MNQSYMNPRNPILQSLFNKRLWLTVSKAFEISRNNTPTILLSFSDPYMDDRNESNADSVLRFFLKPNWKSLKKFISSKYEYICAFIIFSNVFDRSGNAFICL